MSRRRSRRRRRRRRRITRNALQVGDDFSDFSDGGLPINYMARKKERESKKEGRRKRDLQEEFRTERFTSRY